MRVDTSQHKRQQQFICPRVQSYIDSHQAPTHFHTTRMQPQVTPFQRISAAAQWQTSAKRLDTTQKVTERQIEEINKIPHQIRQGERDAEILHSRCISNLVIATKSGIFIMSREPLDVCPYGHCLYGDECFQHRITPM